MIAENSLEIKNVGANLEERIETLENLLNKCLEKIENLQNSESNTAEKNSAFLPSPLQVTEAEFL